MSKRPPSDDELRSLLQMGHFGDDQGPLSLSDPLTRTTIRQVPIDQIDFYDRNPRRVRNPNYDEIKESIRASGVQQNPKITRRPEAPRYMLAFGGNTRLAILRELLAETGEFRFAAVDCDFVPWSSESAILVGHLIENETRGELTFIDKARGVREARALIEAERGRALSLRQLSEALRERGFRVDPATLTRYDYALEILAEAMPRALDAGMGRPQIDRLRRLDAAAQQVWLRRALGADTLYRAVFSEALASADGDSYDFDRLRRAVESALAQRAGVESRLVTLELGAELDDSRPLDDEPVLVAPGNGVPPESSSQPTVPTTAPTSISNSPAPPETAAHPGASSPAPTTSPQARETGPTSNEGREPPPALEQPATGPIVEPHQAPALDEEWLRLRVALSDAGRRYAEQAGLQRCIRIDDDPSTSGYGYQVIDFPDAARCRDARQTDATRQVLAWTFWTLAQCCDLFAFVERRIFEPHATLLERQRACAQTFGADSGFVRAWCDEGAAQQVVDETVGNADAYGYGDYVDAASPELWAADLELRQAFRRLRRFMADRGINAWRDPGGEAST